MLQNFTEINFSQTVNKTNTENNQTMVASMSNRLSGVSGRIKWVIKHGHSVYGPRASVQ